MRWTTPATNAVSKCYTLYADMLQQPHLMIAGATGSGKSVVLNALIYTALYKHPEDKPNGAQFILVDPKGTELYDYRHLPHTLKYADNLPESLAVLNYVLSIIEWRNQAARRKGAKVHAGSDIYIMIDEFADLMTVDKKHVKPLIQRIAQVGRSARVHIVLCTQTPLATVIPTEIKCNFDARLALRTSTARDSRNIIDIKGCELLPNPRTEHRAQGYYRDGADITLCSLPMIPDSELAARVKWWGNQNKALRFLRHAW